MAGPIAGVTRTEPTPTNPAPQTGAKEEAARILDETRIGTGDKAAHRIEFIEAALDKIADTDAALAAAVRAEVVKGLSTTEKYQLEAMAEGTTRDAGNGQTVRFAANSNLTQDQWIDQARAGQYRDFAVFAQLAGANDNASIRKAMDDVQSGRITPSQFANAQTAVDDKAWTDKVGSFLAYFSPTGLVMEAMQPVTAALARNAGIGRTEWGARLQKVLDTPGSIHAFNGGVAAGMLEGAQSFVVSIATLAGKAVQLTGDNSVLGAGGDALRRAVPDSVKNWLRGAGVGDVMNEVLPSAQRGAASLDALARMGGAVGDYLLTRKGVDVAADVGKVIDKMWSSIKDDHAKAAARGPQAEAAWWGKVVGRVTFEIASTLIPYAGQAGKVSKIAKGVETTAEAVNIAEKTTEAIRAEEALRKTVTTVDRVVEGVEASEDAIRTGGKVGDAIPVEKIESAAIKVDRFSRIADKMTIELDHVLFGEINPKGKAVGFHSRPGGIDPGTARVSQRLTPPDANGIYTGKVEIFDSAKNQWIAKRGFSSFYPDRLSAKEVEGAIRNAYADALRRGDIANGAWTGDSGLGFKIQGYVNNGKISTAFPVRIAQ